MLSCNVTQARVPLVMLNPLNPHAGIRAAHPADLGAVEQLCALLRADGIAPPDLISAFGSPEYRHYVVEREGQARVGRLMPRTVSLLAPPRTEFVRQHCLMPCGFMTYPNTCREPAVIRTWGWGWLLSQTAHGEVTQLYGPL